MDRQNPKFLFEKFRILETIKQDSHRAVYIAEHVFLNKRIFLKTINKQSLTNSVLLDRFKREAQILAKLEHPNIIKVWDFGTYENYFYISFEHFQSKNLRELLKQGLPNADDKKKLIMQLMTGLQYAHDHQIIHRDLKPENILIDDNLNLKIADFGLATIEDQAGSTEDTTIVGTPAYMSPEQIQGQELTSQSDLFSLGIIIYEIYRGKNPFLGADTGATLNNILNLNTGLIKDGLEKVPEDIKDLVKGLLSKNINKRPKQINLPGLGVSPKESTEELIKVESSKKNFNRIWIAAAILSVLVISIYFSYKPIQRMIEDQSGRNEVGLVASDTINSNKSEPIELLSTDYDTIDNETITPITMSKIPNEDIQSKETPVIVTSSSTVLKPGFLMIECQPWADIYIDDIKRESTPLKNPLQISAGVHHLKLVHPEYPHYEKSIKLDPEESYHISVNLDTTIGYLSCRVHPWGEVLIDGKLIGQTPLTNFIRLEAGEHKLTVRNPGYSEYSRSFIINKNDTISFNINLGKRDATRTADSS